MIYDRANKVLHIDWVDNKSYNIVSNIGVSGMGKNLHYKGSEILELNFD